MNRELIKDSIRTIKDFPKPGVFFRDITTLINNPAAFRASCDGLTERIKPFAVDKIAAIEARGFIFGSAVALQLGVGLVLLRKKGKLPVQTLTETYSLEYGEDCLELDPTSIKAGERIILMDDLIATGGTALAAANLLHKAGAELTGAQFVVDLSDLGGLNRLKERQVSAEALVSFPGI